ncbi:hypothetical protein [Antarctobacter sp.]|uniref:helix-turn-helix transcriptional regulator n=1 Tax=Antarctobacter sp. TaxID=1872577 RepID=UPI002B2786A0|nr:hypothetical protein [Antarctobacter sp.]
MKDQALTRDDLEVFFCIRKNPGSADRRALLKVLCALGVRLRGGTTRWSVVLPAIGLSVTQNSAHWADLTAPLLTAKDVASLLGHEDPSIIYRWEKGKLPADTPPFPAAIDLSNGRKDARAKRWRRAEVLAWHARQPLPRYAKAAPAFGSITPNKRGPAPCLHTPGTQRNAPRRPGTHASDRDTDTRPVSPAATSQACVSRAHPSDRACT